MGYGIRFHQSIQTVNELVENKMPYEIMARLQYYVQS